MTARDRTVLIVLVLVGAVAGFWFLALSPKRKDARETSAQVTTARQRLDTAQAGEAAAQAARRRYADDYATVARLGKAVPADDDVPSLLYQLETTAHDAKVDFRSVKLSSAGTPTAIGNAAALAIANGKTGSGDGAGSSAAPAALPPGAVVGPAGFPTMPFSLSFQGSFFGLQRFVGAMDDLTKVTGDRIDVRGRLLTVDGIQLKAGPEGFPKVEATIAVTAYVMPDEGLSGGASSAVPAAGTTASTPGGAVSAAASLIGSDR